MKFYSTNLKSKNFQFSETVLQGLAPDGGLFLPNFFPRLPQSFFKNLETLSFKQISQFVSEMYIKDIPADGIAKIIKSALNFPVPLKNLYGKIFILELFHGPTMAFKDFGARFLSRSVGYLSRKKQESMNIIVATSGDTGSAVASGFLKVANTRVFILYPSGKVSPLQEKQLTTFGGNITALEVKGTFDDCQKLAKQILGDESLNRQMRFSSANSINFGRLLPQSFYYFWAAGQLRKTGEKHQPVIVVPSGNLGNIFAGLMAKQMGLPVKKFVAAGNSNNVIVQYLKNGKFSPKKSKKTISNAMDVGNPSNFARMLDLYNHNYKSMKKDVMAESINDNQTRQTIKRVYKLTGYILDPHTAVGVASAEKYQKIHKDKSPIIVLSTAHPAKFKDIVEPIIGKKFFLPTQLRQAMKKKKKTIQVSKKYEEVKKTLLKFSIP